MAVSNLHDQLTRNGRVSRINNDWTLFQERLARKQLGREVVGTNVEQEGKANDEETEPRIAGEQIETKPKMAETEVNVLTNEGRASIPVDATELV